MNKDQLIEGLRVAMLGTTDGDFIDPESDIPAGEMFRLAAEYVEAVYEQAHTPTDDERADALRADPEVQRFADRLFEVGLRSPESTKALLAFKEFRRTVQGEPTFTDAVADAPVPNEGCSGIGVQAHTPTDAHVKPFDTSPEPVKIGADSLRVAPTDDERASIIAELRWLAEARKKYETDTFPSIAREVQTTLHLADILERRTPVAEGGQGFGWIPSWLWDEWDQMAVRRTVQGEPTDAQVAQAKDAVSRIAGLRMLRRYTNFTDGWWSDLYSGIARAALRAAAVTQEGENHD